MYKYVKYIMSSYSLVCKNKKCQTRKRPIIDQLKRKLYKIKMYLETSLRIYIGLNSM